MTRVVAERTHECGPAKAGRLEESTPEIPPLQHDIRPDARDRTVLHFSTCTMVHDGTTHTFSAGAGECTRFVRLVKNYFGKFSARAFYSSVLDGSHDAPNLRRMFPGARNGCHDRRTQAGCPRVDRTIIVIV
jgi:hypothetical protein